MLQFAHLIHAVDSHTEGEPTRVLTGGLPPLRGGDMVACRTYLAEHFDHLRRGLVLEPRGHDAIVLAYLLPAKDPAADVGVVFANDAGYLGMCGHGTIGLCTVLVAMGIMPAETPETRIVLDTPVGLVEAQVEVRDGRPRAVRMRNVPSYVQDTGLEVEVPGHGVVQLDVCYGGNWFAIVDAEQAGVPLEMAHRPRLMDFALRIREALIAAGIQGRDPETGERQLIDHIELTRLDAFGDELHGKNLTLCPGTAYDRSPCGTGTSAKLAQLRSKGRIAPGQMLRMESICGTEFQAQVISDCDFAGREAVVPEIRGRAFITGVQQFVFDPEDPLQFGMEQAPGR